MKREALQPAQHLPCPTHPSDTAGHSWLAHGVKNVTSFIPKPLRPERKSLAEASSYAILHKNLFYELHSQLRAGAAANKDGTSSLGRARQSRGGS